MPLRWFIALLTCAMPLSASFVPVEAAHAVAVTGALRVQGAAEDVTIRLALSEALPQTPRVFALQDPMRWAIDLTGASSMRRDATGSGLVKAARVSQFDPKTVRLVLDLAEPMQLLSAHQDRNQVLEIRLKRTTAAEFKRLSAKGRHPIAGFSQVAPIAVPPGPDAPKDLASDSAARLESVEQILAQAQQSMGPTPPATAKAPPAATATRPAPSVAPPAAPKDEPRLNAPRKKPVATASAKRKRYTVVLDAGHGGTDPGAPSSLGVEKSVTLAVARAAKTAIEKQAKAKGVAIDVRLTRDTDYFISLGGRVRQARQWNADLFISIHADSAGNPSARGASVYTLSEVASDREAARVAAKENRADLIAGVDLSHEDRDVANILVDLGMRDSMNSSAEFASLLGKSLQPEGVLMRPHFHRFANFQVLRNLGVTAVLLETGFLSNTQDAAYLFSKNGQQALANGIAKAVVDYFDHK